MAIKIKAGNTKPTTDDLVDRQLGYDRILNKLYINNNGIIDFLATPYYNKIMQLEPITVPSAITLTDHIIIYSEYSPICYVVIGFSTTSSTSRAIKLRLPVDFPYTLSPRSYESHRTRIGGGGSPQNVEVIFDGTYFDFTTQTLSSGETYVLPPMMVFKADM